MYTERFYQVSSNYLLKYQLRWGKKRTKYCSVCQLSSLLASLFIYLSFISILDCLFSLVSVEITSFIFVQLSPTQQINLGLVYFRLEKKLGSGQFGDVYRGKWLQTNGSREVAVKTLKQEAGEEERVKFLQEAAIMGQFKDPNVVTMYGVVTAGEPVSNCRFGKVKKKLTSNMQTNFFF